MMLEPAAEALNREGSERMMSAYAILEKDSLMFAEANRILRGLPARDRRTLDEAYRRLGRFAPGLSYGQAEALCRLGMRATRNAAGLEPVA
ncbi:hypothetical protein [Bifidobacterium sp. SO1]|uniref:hypothetical protein n=1 Tax=Bifidobacterium sp. SO1 TaxID=2809029 RepID=UPI001F0AC2A3|nr:hypothetical protein [Bifidobacterium sp. SO1]